MSSDLKMFGLGERFEKFELKLNTNYNMWSYDYPMVDGQLDI